MGERANELPNAGDLCVKVHACCAQGAKSVGVIEKVERIFVGANVSCPGCGYSARGLEIVDTPNYLFVRAWCRRIPPLSELSSIDIVTELESERTRERTEA